MAMKSRISFLRDSDRAEALPLPQTMGSTYRFLAGTRNQPGSFGRSLRLRISDSRRESIPGGRRFRPGQEFADDGRFRRVQIFRVRMRAERASRSRSARHCMEYRSESEIYRRESLQGQPGELHRDVRVKKRQFFLPVFVFADGQISVKRRISSGVFLS